MLSILQKVHPMYHIVEMSALGVVLLLSALLMPTVSNTSEETLKVAHVDNISSIFLFKLPTGKRAILSAKMVATIGLKSTVDVNVYPFTLRTIMDANESSQIDRYSLQSINGTSLEVGPFEFYNQEFFNVTSPSFKVAAITRNPNINRIDIMIKYTSETHFPYTICSFFALSLLLFSGKMNILFLVILYFLAFMPWTANFGALLYCVFCAFFVFVAFKQTSRHSKLSSSLSDVLVPIGIATSIGISTFAFLHYGLNTAFEIPSSPIAIFIGISVCQLIGLIATNQNNITIFFDLIGTICMIAPFFGQIFLPVYFSALTGAGASQILAAVLSLHGVFCLILSEAYIERDDIVSEGVIGVIARESSSSSADMVMIERDETLRIGKVRNIDMGSMMISAVPSIVGFVSIVAAQFVGLPKPDFQLVSV